MNAPAGDMRGEIKHIQTYRESHQKPIMATLQNISAERRDVLVQKGGFEITTAKTHYAIKDDI